jgi:cytochrome c peroxidase
LLLPPKNVLLPLASLALLALAGAQEARHVRVPADTLPRPLPSEVPPGLAETELGQLELQVEASELGRRLFFEPALSADGEVACATCHRPEHGLADDVARSVGVGGALTERNTPTLFNRALGERFMWRGEVASLEEQVLLPIANPLEMGLSVEQAVARLAASEEYAAAFEEVFGGPPTRERLAVALAAFVERLWLGDSPFDRFRAGERDALTAEERGGMWFFQSRGQCWRCHGGPSLTDEQFHNTGIGSVEGVPLPGREALTGDEADRGAFKTPTLRGIELTAPYMHDGSLATLEEVVTFYREGARPNSHLSSDLAPIEMSDVEAANLLAFLRALTPRSR